MASSPESSSSAEKSQYQHFIPRFILRNFAHTYTPPTGKTRPKRNRDVTPRKAGLRPREPALHIIDLSSDDPKLTEFPIRRAFGLTDMYRDFAKASDQNHLEKQLSSLESEAAKVISKIRKAFESSQQAVWISRQERNILRKFLFIMKYRGKDFHKRFVIGGMEGYVEDDKEEFLKYMRENDFQKPVEVWIRSIKVILELKMDLQGKWMQELTKQIYPDDAMWFIMHTEWMYLALCTPSDTEMEFILTENSYNVFEGPQTNMVDPLTGGRRCMAWTNFHEFAPISPKLLMVLRSFVLPNPEEDMDENIKKWRENLFTLSTGPHRNPTTNSILAHLPIKKAQNSYSSVTSYGIKLDEGEDGSRRGYHRFCFPFFKLATEDVNKINAIFLENAYACQAVAFTSHSALRVAIDNYLTLPATEGFKYVGHHGNGPNLSYLVKLENISRKLGSDKGLVYQSHGAELTDDRIFETFSSSLAEHLPEQPTEFMQLYMKLGERPSDDQRTFLTAGLQVEALRPWLRTWTRRVGWLT